jgi:hypothetical protein
MNNFYSKTEEYDIPSRSPYLKFEDGDTRFRILGAFSEGTAIQGWVYWKTSADGKRKPIRVTKDTSIPASEIELNKYGEPDIPKFFWTFPVWNYEAKQVQIAEITQKSILNFIKKQIDNPKWGDPREYDFIVTREKQGEKVVYTATNDPKEKLEADIKKQYESVSINVYALFEGKDPFAAEDISPEEVEKGLEVKV